ncbi:hypothetical protein NQ317_003296 [Molorchus minor]|uniref:Coenzyme Q-binding protein COQ10 START domain-containing protein n=1 Tax=Molorchus minor TaxID=1323400 RepID=A0ABQ9J6U3_9CUCU|nr:hypothetical protein NQ317_003296 [Molorchus minor]
MDTYIYLKVHKKRKEHFARKLVGKEMYSVVADVRHYKQFLPFCTKSTILTQEAKQIKANLEIGFPPIVESYTSTVTLEEPTVVRAICTDGRIFNYLETNWRFSPGLKSNPKSCIIDFYIKFEFKSALYSQVAFMFFDKLVNQMETAFLNEARRRYGQESLSSHKLSPVKS